MINVENNRFPHSAELFKFCKEVLSLRKNVNEKVTDQDVGALLGFDPADCTHWKYGRKNIKSIQNMNQLAKALDVDPRGLIDLSLGKNLLYDAIMEYNGYGDFSCQRDYRQILKEEADKIIETANIKALPVLIPELTSAYSDIEIRAQDGLSDKISLETVEGKTFIFWNQSEKIGVSLRFLLVQEFAKCVLQKEHLKKVLPEDLSQNFVNTLALFLLMPSYLLQIAFSQCDPAKDSIEQLMERFWVSRTLVNIRLKDFLIYRN